jgi:hypothetical protein
MFRQSFKWVFGCEGEDEKTRADFEEIGLRRSISPKSMRKVGRSKFLPLGIKKNGWNQLLSNTFVWPLHQLFGGCRGIRLGQL